MTKVKKCSWLLAVVLVAGLVAGPTPAQASPGVCSGTGTLTTTKALFYPPPAVMDSDLVTTAFTITLDEPNTCGPSHTGTAIGELTGHCGKASGFGVWSDHHPFMLEWASDTLILWSFPSNEAAYGIFFINPHPLATPPESCLAGATSFLVGGKVTLISEIS